jgi:hypothetical protein
MPRLFSICEITMRTMSPEKKPNPPTPVERRNPMSPRKSSELEDPPLPRELELLECEPELDELLCELELLEREPLLKDWPPPGRASKKVTLGETAVLRSIGAAAAVAAANRTAATAPARNVGERCRRGLVMQPARRGAR